MLTKYIWRNIEFFLIQHRKHLKGKKNHNIYNHKFLKD